MDLKIIFGVQLSCCITSFLMGLLMTHFSESSNFITFLQFLFISLKGLVTTKFFSVPSKIPIREYCLLVILYFITNTANNYVYTLHIHSTLHMIIRSASLFASMLTSWLVKGRIPKKCNIYGSLILTLGVFIAMYGDAKLVENKPSIFYNWCIGVCILMSTLFLGAFSGLQQEKLYEKYGKHPEEMMFYINIMPLPFFVTIYPSIKSGFDVLNLYGFTLIGANIISQYYCLLTVHRLATKENSVTVTLVLTLRKFLSLLISALVFNNNFTYLHLIGTILVVIGTCIYFDWFNRIKPTRYDRKIK